MPNCVTFVSGSTKAAVSTPAAMIVPVHLAGCPAKLLYYRRQAPRRVCHIIVKYPFLLHIYPGATTRVTMQFRPNQLNGKEIILSNY